MAGDRTVDGPDASMDRRQSLDIGSLLADGVDGLVSVTGAQLVVVLAGLGIVSTALWQTLFVTAIESLLTYIRGNVDVTTPEMQRAITELDSVVDSVGLAVDLSIPVVLVGLLVLALVSEAVMIVAARVFADGALDGIPIDLATRRLPMATLYGFFGGLLVMIAVSVGLVLLVVPGVIVYVGTLFFRQEIAIAEKGPLQAISGSWTLTKGNRWFLLALALVLIAVGFVAGFVVGFVPGTAGTVVHTVVTSAVGVFAIAVITNAYVRLRAPQRP
ncbi:hypothetical protein [Halorhabdus amylolytica]|uniref:hypothetical protein n=1 Tax=Halorhabdus amylolytica TaxID=2559573 RepID=UPI0010AAAA3D|nr:hypothetical protein [Halorhabdus amylolytica]